MVFDGEMGDLGDIIVNVCRRETDVCSINTLLSYELLLVLVICSVSIMCNVCRTFRVVWRWTDTRVIVDGASNVPYLRVST